MLSEKVFETREELEAWLAECNLLTIPSVTLIRNNHDDEIPREVLIRNKSAGSLTADHSDEYLTFDALETGTFTYTIHASITPAQLESVSYSIDDGKTWITTNNVSGSAVTITTPSIQAGKSVMWKGISNKLSAVDYTQSSTSGSEVTSTQYFSKFSSSGNFNAHGNVFSMNYGDAFGRTSPINTAGQVAGLFKDCTKLKSVEDLFIGTGSMNADYTHAFMFYRCTGLEDIPNGIDNLESDGIHRGQFRDLFANCTSLTSDAIFTKMPQFKTLLSPNLYEYMFYNCTGLTTYPEDLLPATELQPYCYRGLFYGCTGITDLYEDLLPATDLTGADYCYNAMFYQTHVSELPEGLFPASTLSLGCYQSMFGYTNIDEIPVNLFESVDALTERCYCNMFCYCTHITSIPAALLPKTTLAPYCYAQMFDGCSGLTSIPANLLPATDLTGASYCYQAMFRYCTGLTSVPQNLLPATTLSTYCYSAMFRYDTGITSVPVGLLHATTMVTRCYDTMFANCTGITSLSAGLLPATNLAGADYCYYAMFYQCTNANLTSLPVGLLPATTLSGHCYEQLFDGCNKLTSLSAGLLPATVLTTYCYSLMFNGCTALTSIAENLLPATTLNTYCYDRMFQGCTNANLTIPENLLHSRVLVQRCYNMMFKNCTGLKTIPKNFLPAKILPAEVYVEMFNGCTALTDICALPGTRTTGASCYYNMFMNCRALIRLERVSLNNTTTYTFFQMYFRNNYNTAPFQLVDASNVLLHPEQIAGQQCCSSMFAYHRGMAYFPHIAATSVNNTKQIFDYAFRAYNTSYRNTSCWQGFNYYLTTMATSASFYTFRQTYDYCNGIYFFKSHITAGSTSNNWNNWNRDVQNSAANGHRGYAMVKSTSYLQPAANWFKNPTQIVSIHNYTDVSASSQILPSGSISSVSSLSIDEVAQGSVTSTYQYEATGWHTNKFTLTTDTVVPNSFMKDITNLTRLVIGANIVTIGDYAFDGCTNLQFALTGFNITTVGNYAFRNCTSLRRIEFSPGLVTIGNYAFQNCELLKAMIFKASIETIGTHAFDGCSTLENLDIASTLTSIGDYAFAGCYNLDEIFFRGPLPTFNANAFPVSDSEHTVEYTFTLLAAQDIPANAFAGLTGLVEVNLGWNSTNQIGSIGNNAFSGCTNLREIFIDNTTPPTITSTTFANTNNTFKIYVPNSAVETYRTAEVWSTYASRIFGD